MSNTLQNLINPNQNFNSTFSTHVFYNTKSNYIMDLETGEISTNLTYGKIKDFGIIRKSIAKLVLSSSFLTPKQQSEFEIKHITIQIQENHQIKIS